MIGLNMIRAKVIALRKFKRRYRYELRSRYFNREWVERTLRQCRKTGTPCSCHMCGNPRKWFKERTRKEKFTAAPPQPDDIT